MLVDFWSILSKANNSKVSLSNFVIHVNDLFKSAKYLFCSACNVSLSCILLNDTYLDAYPRGRKLPSKRRALASPPGKLEIHRDHFRSKVAFFKRVKNTKKIQRRAVTQAHRVTRYTPRFVLFFHLNISSYSGKGEKKREREKVHRRWYIRGRANSRVSELSLLFFWTKTNISLLRGIILGGHERKDTEDLACVEESLKEKKKKKKREYRTIVRGYLPIENTEWNCVINC